MDTLAKENLAAYLTELKIEKRASPLTIKNYRRDIEQLMSFCTEHAIPHWRDVGHQNIRSHIARRHRQGISGKSLQRELSAIRSFYKYLLKIGLKITHIL